MRCRASITLFMCMTIMMITSLGFTLMEVSRFLGVDKKGDFVTATVADNTFSEYIKPLWDQYGILAIDRAHGTNEDGDSNLRARILEFADEQLDGEQDYFALNPTSADIDDYMLLTDNDGSAFIHEAAIYYTKNIGNELTNLIGNTANQAGGYISKKGEVDKLMGDGNNTLKNPPSPPKSEDGESDEPPKTSLSPDQIEKGSRLMDDVDAFKSKGVLAQVIPSDKKISDKEFDLNNSVSHRTLATGNSSNPSKATTIDKIIFSVYLKDRFQNYTKELGHTGLKYETEYIVIGDDNDMDNLKGVVGILLALRSVANFGALYNDTGRSGEAYELAVALVGWTLLPPVIEIVRLGIMAAWSYMEAVLDVRLLLDGGKVSMLKSPAEWTSDLYNIASCMDANYTARNCESGMSYEDYLVLLLIIESSRDESLRAMDMVETSINAVPNYENIKMDRLICDMNMTVTYEADPMFFSLITLDVPFPDYYHMQKKVYRTYL